MTERLQSSRVRVLLYEGPGSRPLADDRRFELLESMLDAGWGVTCPADSGGVAPLDDSPHVVLGDFERDGITFDAGEAHVDVRNIDRQSSVDVLAELGRVSDAAGAVVPGGWKPWFPVIDYDRCTNCMQCLTFCLFDVYGVDEEQKISVRHQDHCKTDCPACSRVCPEAAILFPKYKAGPINGAPVKPEDLKSESMKVDISALLGGDIYGALRSRQRDARERFSTERDESRALLERKRCLKKLGDKLDIPAEVLMTLPSVEDIEQRARRAKEKMEKRRERSQTVHDEKKRPSEEEWGI